MKNLSLIAFIAFIGLFTCTGCSRSSSSSAAPSYDMTATIGSTSLNATACIAAETGGILAISGSTVTSGVGGTPQIDITISGWSGAPGTTTIGTSSTSCFAEYTATPSNTLLSQSGTITITYVSSTVIKGTFSFTCVGGTTVSSGVFTASVQ